MWECIERRKLCLGIFKHAHQLIRLQWSYMLSWNVFTRDIVQMNRPNGQQCLAKTIIDHSSLWWLNRNVHRNETALLECPSTRHARTHGQTDNMQFLVWHGSQNLCQTITSLTQQSTLSVGRNTVFQVRFFFSECGEGVLFEYDLYPTSLGF